MARKRFPATPAVRMLRQHGVSFSLHGYPYEEGGGTRGAAEALGVDAHRVIKTLVMETDAGEPFLVLMHGDKETSTKGLARFMGVKRVSPCDPETAGKHTGYVVGGISPFGTRKQLPVFLETSVLELPKIFINAGKRGLLAEVAPEEVVPILNPRTVRVAIDV